MPIQSIFRFKNHALMMALAAAFPVASYGAGAAKVDFAVGAVNAVSTAGAQRAINKGAELGSGESIVTGDGGRAQLRFTDGGMVSLQPGTEFKVDNYQFSGKEDGEEKGFFSLLKGGLRTITGLVGRTNKNAYKVTTNVATIGIRGTEFTIAYTGANSIAVSTGEGMIEVCNNAGCALIPAGTSAIVTGPNTEVKRSEVKPRLDPAQPPGDVQPVFSTSDARQSNGLIAPVSPPLVSGSGYAVSYVESDNGFHYLVNPVSATFNNDSSLTSFSDGYDVLTAGSVAGSFSADGVIGWGRWTSGVKDATAGSGSLYDLRDMHYVTGIPTPNIGNVTGVVNATYSLIGYTLPTSENGLVGQAPSGYLVATISSASIGMGVSLSVPIGGSVFGINTIPGSGSLPIVASSATPDFSFNTASASVKGFFAGSNASHVGLTYRIDSGDPYPSGMGYVNGAAAFKR